MYEVFPSEDFNRNSTVDGKKNFPDTEIKRDQNQKIIKDKEHAKARRSGEKTENNRKLFKDNSSFS